MTPNYHVVTLFPAMFAALTDFGVSGRALKNGRVRLRCWDPRDFTCDNHRTVDDRPFGGGPGMVMLAEPLDLALTAVKTALAWEGVTKPRMLHLSPQGRVLDHALVCELARESALVLLASRYEGIDERLFQRHALEEVSIGDYVLSGGELPAMVLLDAVIRQLPGVLGHEDSAAQDSFANGLLDCPHYTRPEEYLGLKVPEVLRSGDHTAIACWRSKEALRRTLARRPELLVRKRLSAQEQVMLDEIRSEGVPVASGAL